MNCKHPRATTPLHTLLALSCVTACTTAPTGDDGEAIDEPQWEMAESSAARDLNPQLTPAETEAIAIDQQALALDLYHVLREDEFADESFAISSYSIAAAFGMLYGGTVGDAQAQMESTLHFSLADERQHVAHNWLDQQLAARNLDASEDGSLDPVIVQTANGVWLERGLRDEINPSYLDLLATHYGAGVHLADFRNNYRTESDAINRWVSSRTRELIPELLPPYVIKWTTNMVLVNALYLKAPWAVPFDRDSTRKATFTKLDGSDVQVDTMYGYALAGSYAEEPDYTALAIPLRNSALEVVFVVPHDFAEFEASLDQPTLDAVLTSMQGDIVNAYIPRLELETNISLVKALRDELGMPTPFDDESAFDDIVPGLGVIKEVIHKTVIKLDEDGTEAAAATAIVIGDEVGGDDPSATFRADKPFFLMIRDSPTQSVLFFGRVLEP